MSDAVDAWIMANYPKVFWWFLVAVAVLYSGTAIAAVVARLRGDRAATVAIITGATGAAFLGGFAWIVSTTL